LNLSSPQQSARYSEKIINHNKKALNMRLHLCQSDINWEEPQKNINDLNQELKKIQISSGDLIIFPEMYSTGFSMRQGICCDLVEGEQSAIKFLKDLSKQYSCCIIGGVATKREGEFYNESLAALPDGNLISYKKVNLFPLAQEDETYSPGKYLETFKWNSWIIGMSICYDLRFPEIYRGLALRNSNLIVNIANWPIDRIDHWVTLLKARAIENQCFIAGVNRTGTDPNSIYNGRSMIIDPLGQIIIDAGETKGIFSSEIEIDKVNSWRNDFPALKSMKSKT
jgi:predicted amidohydrolase